LQSPQVALVPCDTVVTVKKMSGRRAQIVEPMEGWISVRNWKGNALAHEVGGIDATLEDSKDDINDINIPLQEYTMQLQPAVTFAVMNREIRSQTEQETEELVSEFTKCRKNKKHRRRKEKSQEVFKEFRGRIFNESEYKLVDPFYYVLFPNLLSFLFWPHFLSLFMMIFITILFHLCGVLMNPFWRDCSRTLIAYLTFCFAKSGIFTQFLLDDFIKKTKIMRIVFFATWFEAIPATVFVMFLRHYVFISHRYVYSVGLCAYLIMIKPIFHHFVSFTLSVKFKILDREDLIELKRKQKKHLNVASVILRLLLLSQVASISFWSWLPGRVTFLCGQYWGAFVITALLNVSKYGYLFIFSSLMPRVVSYGFSTGTIYCLYFSGFQNYLVLMSVKQDQYSLLIFMYGFLNFFEILYHALVFSLNRDPLGSLCTAICCEKEQAPKTFDILTNQRSVYISMMEIVKVVVSLYFSFTTFLISPSNSGQTQGLKTPVGLDIPMHDSSFSWYAVAFLVWEISTCFLMLWILLRYKKLSLTYDFIHLLENEFLFPILVVIPFSILGNFFISLLSFDVNF